MLPLSRRRFLHCAAATAATLSSGLEASSLLRSTLRSTRLNILILGGTGYLGPATITAALARGHRVTMFNRGKTRPELFPGVERLQGDRDPLKGNGLKSLEGRDWDVVIDNSAYYPRLVGASAALLAPRCKHYIIISSISAYATPYPMNGDETTPLASMDDPTLEDMGPQMRHYGALKALCENAAEAAMPGRVTVVRPGFIVGPDDPSGRFAYWPVRIDQGGEVAVPGQPEDPLQIIDVRDLGNWLIHLAEQGKVGAFNACGPERRLAWGEVVEACLEATTSKPSLVWLPTDFMLKPEAAEVQFPIWAPFAGESQGFHTWDNRRAVAAGLQFRPVAATVRDTLAWYKAEQQREQGRTKLAGPSPEAETKLIAAWKQQALHP